MKLQEKAILQTLAYSSVFHFPLTKDELWYFLISDEKIEKEDFEQSLKTLQGKVHTKNGFYVLAGQEGTITTRIKNTSELHKKMRIAKRAAYYLSYIPTIKLIGISGGVAMGKAEQDDDIDLFIITKKNTLFMTRLWIQAILEMLQLRRKRSESNAKNKICVNLLIDETQLSWPQKAHDVYTAHEIAQVKPFFERNKMYETFLYQNKWIEKFLPNTFKEAPLVVNTGWKRNYKSLQLVSAVCNLWPFQKIVGFFQKRYMKRFQTTEIVTEHVLAFHPIDYRSKTLKNLNMELQQLGLLTNK